jgi:solute carrier family 25 S-adenosylmethionine transporter 26
LVRTPTEIVKQRMQTGMYKSIGEAFVGIRSAEGLVGFYRGYWSLIAREIPFSFIQFPLWEGLKVRWLVSSQCGGRSTVLTSPSSA